MSTLATDGQPLTTANTPKASPSGPISPKTRIMGIDVARGFALLGILMVNVTFFSEPFLAFAHGVPHPEPLIDKLVYWFTALFCTGKFYPLFSTLFGAGVAIMLNSARQSGRSFSWLYLRRMMLLGLFGIAHILLLWSGDILLLYSMVGLSMLLLSRASPKVLLIVAAISFGIGTLLTIGFSLLTFQEPPAIASAEIEQAVSLPEADSRVEQFLAIVSDSPGGGELDPRLTMFEREIQSKGPFLDAMLLRLLLYAFAMVYYIAIAVWVVLTCFCVGAALVKIGFFQQADCVWRKRLLWSGMLIGLPLSLTAVYLEQYRDGAVVGMLSVLGTNMGGPLMCWAYLSAAVMLAERQPGNMLLGAMSNLGRMALSGYLLESLIMSAIMLHWGLGWFGTTTWSQRFGLALGVYACVLLLANVWLVYFRLGPMEWLWRSMTYWKMQPLLREVSKKLKSG